MWGIQLAKKEKIGFMIGVIFMLFALVDNVIIAPINSRIKKIDKQIKLSQKELGVEARNVAQKDTLIEEYKQYVSGILDTGSDEEIIASMLTEIEDFGREASISLLDVKPQATKDQNTIKQFNIAIEAEGEMADLIRFLYKLNQSKQLLRVETLRLNLKDKDSKLVKASVLVTKITIPS